MVGQPFFIQVNHIRSFEETYGIRLVYHSEKLLVIETPHATAESFHYKLANLLQQAT